MNVKPMGTENIKSMAGTFHGIHIDLGNDTETKNWCKVFKCTLYELRKAVMKVGTSAVSVEAFLEMNNMKRIEE
ncbi:MAG: DUF3606 domain-containing protein [Flavobacteriales bacterium]